MPLSPQATVSIDRIAGLLLFTISQLRLRRFESQPEANTWTFHILSYSFQFFVALLPVLTLSLARPFYFRWRTSLAIFVRLGVMAVVVTPHVLPATRTGACGAGTIWNWLLNSHAPTSALVSLGFPLPIRTHMWPALLQQAALLVTAADRCRLGPSSFLDQDAAHCSAALASLLDWPFMLMGPAIWPEGGRMSPRAACLACTLWVQLVVGGLLPTAVLWSHTTDAAERRRGLGSLGDACLGDMSAERLLFAAQMLWMGLRTVCAVALPADPLPPPP